MAILVFVGGDFDRSHYGVGDFVGGEIITEYTALQVPSLTYTDQGKNYLALRFYGDYVVSAPYEEEMRPTKFFWRSGTEHFLMVRREISIMKLGEKDSPNFVQRVGYEPLALKDSLQGLWGWLFANLRNAGGGAGWSGSLGRPPRRRQSRWCPGLGTHYSRCEDGFTMKVVDLSNP